MKKLSLFLAALLLLSTNLYAEPQLQVLQGETVPLNALKGKWVFLNYWAGWCQSCINEIPDLNRFYKSHKKDDNIVLYAVNYDNLPAAELQHLLSRVGIKYPSLYPNPAKDLHLGDINGVPVTFVFNPEGKLAKVLYGPQTQKNLEEAML